MFVGKGGFLLKLSHIPTETDNALSQSTWVGSSVQCGSVKGLLGVSTVGGQHTDGS